MTETTPPDPPVLSDGDCERLWRMLLERAAERTSAAEGKLAEVRETVTTFLGHYGNSKSASFKVALDLAHGMTWTARFDEFGWPVDRSFGPAREAA